MAGMKRTTRTPIVLPFLALLTLLPLCACRAAAPAPRAPEQILAEARALDVVNARAPLPGVLAGGQISEVQMSALARSGYRKFVNLRASGEEGTGWEAERARALGVSYVSIPVAGAGDVSEPNARRLAAELASAGGPVVVYCQSSNRVGALLALQAYHVGGASPEEALALGQAAGLTRLEPVVRAKLGL